MWLDAVALAVLGLFVVVGLLRGALVTGMALVSLVVAYLAAVLAAPALGAGLAEALSVPEVIGFAAAGTLAFFAAYIAMGVLTRILKRVQERRGVMGRSPRDRFLGAVFGAVRGAFVVLLVAYLAIWLDALRVTGRGEVVPSIEGSAAASVAESVVEAGVGAAMEDGPAARLVARMAGRPGATLSDVEKVLGHPGITDLQDDRLFWTYVEHGSYDAALNQKSFLAVSYDPGLRGRLADLGFIDESAASDPQAFRSAARDVLAEVSPRIQGLRNDPELQALVEDPEVRAMLESGNTMGLLGHEGFRRLVARVSAEQN